MTVALSADASPDTAHIQEHTTVAYINCGAGGRTGHFASKRAFKDALATDPTEVMFYGTSMFDDEFGRRDGAEALQFLTDHPGSRLTVVGPDPYQSRKWYATVTVKAGKLQVQ